QGLRALVPGAAGLEASAGELAKNVIPHIEATLSETGLEAPKPVGSNGSHLPSRADRARPASVNHPPPNENPGHPAGVFSWFFSQLRGERRTADPAELLFSRQQNGAGRGRSGLYVPAGWLEGLSRMGLASGGSGRPVLGGAGTGARRGRRAPVFGL